MKIDLMQGEGDYIFKTTLTWEHGFALNGLLAGPNRKYNDRAVI